MLPKIPAMPGAPRPMADMEGRRKPLRPVKKKKVPGQPIDRRAIERVKSVL